MDSPENKLWSIIDLAEARLRDDRVTDENVRHDLAEIARLAKDALHMLAPEAS